MPTAHTAYSKCKCGTSLRNLPNRRIFPTKSHSTLKVSDHDASPVSGLDDYPLFFFVSVRSGDGDGLRQTRSTEIGWSDGSRCCAADLCPDSKRGEGQLPALLVPAERGEVLFIKQRYPAGDMGVKNVRTLPPQNIQGSSIRNDGVLAVSLRR